ncbi:MAG: hypothetical protein ACTSXJ_11000 [Candidatus Baldrarchaeia archaeon]
MKRNIVGLIVSAIILILLIVPYPMMPSPHRLFQITDPMAGIWYNALNAKPSAERKIEVPGLEHKVTVLVDAYGFTLRRDSHLKN